MQNVSSFACGVVAGGALDEDETMRSIGALLTAVAALWPAACGQQMHVSGDPQGQGSIEAVRTEGNPLSVTPTGDGGYAIDFGVVLVGQETNGLVALANSGVAQLKILSVAGPINDAFQVPLNVGEAVQAGAQVNLDLSFAPTIAGQMSGKVVIQTDSARTPTITLTLMGSGTLSDGG